MLKNNILILLFITQMFSNELSYKLRQLDNISQQKRFELMNEIKKDIAKLNSRDRIQAINKLRNRVNKKNKIDKNINSKDITNLEFKLEKTITFEKIDEEKVSI